jgi:hypothetical protein
MRDAVFQDFYHIPQWRLCAIQDCPSILRSPAFVCRCHTFEELYLQNLRLADPYSMRPFYAPR